MIIENFYRQQYQKAKLPGLLKGKLYPSNLLKHSGKQKGEQNFLNNLPEYSESHSLIRGPQGSLIFPHLLPFQTASPARWASFLKRRTWGGIWVILTPLKLYMHEGDIKGNSI